jgi:AcrR family transcriptional regulator
VKLNSGDTIHEEIVGCATQLFNTNGVRNVTMDEIAHELGISKKTIYNYYPGKNELVAAVYVPLLQRAETDCLNLVSVSKDAIDEALLCWRYLDGMLKEIGGTVIRDLAKYHHGVHKQFLLFKNVFLKQLANNNILRGISESVYRSEVNPLVMSVYCVSVIDLFYWKQKKFSDKKSVEVPAELMIHYLFGLSSMKGVKLLNKYIDAGYLESENHNI